MRKLIFLIIVILVLLGSWNTLKMYVPRLSHVIQKSGVSLPQPQQVKVVTEESVTINAVKKVGPSVVTVVGQAPVQGGRVFDLGPFSFQAPDNQPPAQQSIGSGFIISSDGFVVTNRHVVSDTSGKYQIVTADDKKYDVKNIYRDPLNDVAILKIDPAQNADKQLVPVEMGDSSKLQVGQFAIAIGTALGQFRNTVTTGVVSGLGRGIQAGSLFEGYVEKLDNVIQTSAAINPGNSGGPLVNSASQVIGINTAVAENGQNIGFALPINVVKDSLKNFNQTGQFNRPYLGVGYKTVTRDLALMNDIPEGAYVQRVVAGSPADKAGIQQGDIIIKIDNQRVGEGNGELVNIVSHKKVGDTITVIMWRDGKTTDVKVTLTASQ